MIYHGASVVLQRCFLVKYCNNVCFIAYLKVALVLPSILCVFLFPCKSVYWEKLWKILRKKSWKYLVRMVKSSTFALAFGKEHGSNESKRSLKGFKRESSLNGWNTSKQGSTPAGFMKMWEGRQIQANRQSSIDRCTRSSSGRRTDKEKSPSGESRI